MEMELPFLFLDTQQFQASSRGEGGRRAPRKGAGEKEEARAAPTHGSLGNRYFGYLRNIPQPRHFCCSARSVYPSTKFIRTEAYSTVQLGASVVQ